MERVLDRIAALLGALLVLAGWVRGLVRRAQIGC
jgi:hypothetical protein